MTKRDDKQMRAVIHDRWDVQTYEGIKKEIKALPVATESLKEIIPDTAWAQMADTFDLFMKSSPDLFEPDEVRAQYLVNRVVDGEMLDLPVYQELRRFTRGDKVSAAMATVKIEPELEILHDRQKERQKQADELDKLKDKLQDLLQQLLNQQGQPQPPPPGDGEDEEGQGQPQPGDGPPDGQGSQQSEDQGDGQGDGQGQGEQSLQEQIDQMKQMIEALENALKEGLDSDVPDIRAQLQAALQEAVDQARADLQASNAFGYDKGQLMRMPADARLKLAKQLNNPRIKKIAENFGPLRNMAFASKVRKVAGIPHEFLGIETGDDLEHLLLDQLAFLDEEDLELAFYADYADQRLLQYKLQGTEHVGKGGIILCEDGSGSMSGQRELWAKAFMLVLLNIAKQELREFHLLHFGGQGELYEFPFREAKDFTVENIIKAAEVFCNGGTDFATPLNRALKLLEEEHSRTGKVQSDIVFLTDGQSYLSAEWIEDFVHRLDKIGGACWGILVGGEPQNDPLFSVCEGKTCRLADLTSKSKKEVRAIFQGLQRPSTTVKKNITKK